MNNEKIKISGIAVREGTSRNRRKYIAKELHKFAPTLEGRPILKDHEGITDNVIGKITETRSIDNGKLVEYTGWIKEDGTGIIEKIKDGRISEVSIGAMAGKVVKEKKDDDVIIPVDMEALELSTTPVPGNKGTSLNTENKIDTNLDLSENTLKEMIKEFTVNNDTIDKNIKGDKKMDTNTTNVDENMKLELRKLKEELEASKKSNESLEKENASLEEQRKLDAIAKYKKVCESKKVTSKDLSEADMAMITFATETVEELPEPKEEDDKKDDDTKDDVKKDAVTQSQDASKDVDDDKATEAFEGYVISHEDVVGGVALFKYY